MKLADYFKIVMRFSPKRTLLVVASILSAGALEGVSFALFLPLIQVMTQGASSVKLPLVGIEISVPVLLGVILALFTFKAVLIFFQKYFTASLTLDFERSIKQDIYSSVFESDWRFYMREKTGTLANAMSQHARIASDAFKILLLAAAEAVNVLIYCLVGIWISVPAFLLSAAVGAGLYFPLKKFINRSREIGAQTVAVKNESMTHVIEDFSAIKAIKGNRLEEFRTQHVFDQLGAIKKLEFRGDKFGALMDSLPDLMMAVVASAILFVSFRWLKVPGANLLVLVMALYRLNRRLLLFQGYKQRLFLYLPYYDSCREIIRKAREKKEVSGSHRFEALQKGIELSNINFSYGDRPVLQSFSMTIQKNALTAIVGRSGSGKTTAVDLVTGLLKPDHGCVLIDGRNLAEYDIASWRKRIAYVSQEVLLVNGSIEDNIRMDQKDASPEALIEAARQAHADEFIRLQPDGYKTLVGDRGLRLSGGQRQRIALARALLRRPELLILDEATSALDSESEKMVQNAIEFLRGKLTILVIAHRFSTIGRADMVYVLENGKSVESGHAAELKEKSEAFQQLYDLR